MATIGLRDVYFATLTTDPIGGTATYSAPVRLAGAMTANINPNTATGTLFGDDGPSESAATLGEITLELGLTNVSAANQATLLGHTFEGGILKKKSSDVPPYVAVGFRSLKSNGKYKYFWLNKGKFAAPEEDLATKGDKIDFKTPTLKGSFVKRDSDDEWERVGDEDEVTFTTAIKDAWFTSPIYVAVP